jgi:hypothetical protein
MQHSHSSINTLLVLVAVMAVVGGLTIVIVTSPQSWQMGPGAWFQAPATITAMPTSTRLPTATSVPTTVAPTPTATAQVDQVLPTSTTPAPTEAPTDLPAPPATPTLAPDVRALAVVTVVDGVNTGRVRNLPGGDVVIAAIPAGTVVEVLYEEATIEGINWLRIRMENGRIGWMASFLLTFTQQATP